MAMERWRTLTHGVVASGAAGSITTRSPWTGEALADLPLSTPEDVGMAVQRTRARQPEWAARSARERAGVLLRWHDLVLRRQDEVLDLIQLETGKARTHAFDEVAHVAMVARWYARRGPAMLDDERHVGLVPGLTRIREVHHPRGVVGVIAPWNYPLTLGIGDALAALLAGNAVVIKPDEKTTVTALWAARLLREAGLPEGVVQVVAGDGPGVGGALVGAVDYVCFTGSTAVGRLIAEQAGGRLIGCSLELGGKNALYVAADADLDRAAEGAVRDCFGNAGQLCVSTERLLLHADIAEAFLERFLGRVRRLRLGAALDYSTDVGSLVSAEQLRRVATHVDDAVAQGARVLAGGRARPDLGPTFYEPTVLADVPPAAVCFTQETFGPVVMVRIVPDDESALAVIDEGEFGLTASFWTRDPARGAALARRVSTGTASVNETYAVVFGSVTTPMGGRRASGLGRRHGLDGLRRFTETQSVATQHVVGLGPLYARGPGRVASLFTGALRTARAARLPWP
ncbi:MAG: aldehyde dehydrogenase family protein [Kineosporiaceae bacterium]|nr:aldehyde dehydrogenase family protein [Kineosporiaceae bacterium]